MSETLLHYSPVRDFALDRTRVYETPRPAKPRGLWVSVADAWREWREGENWGIPAEEYVYEVALSPTACILRVDGEGEISRLHDRFPRREKGEDRLWARYPDWSAIIARYDGILIPAYSWSCRFDVDWYYSWDCASGCVWNLSAIADVKHVGTLAATVESR